MGQEAPTRAVHHETRVTSLPTIVLAIADPAVRDACERALNAAGHTVLVLDRPLALFSLGR
jgi:hypothetical protein